MYLNSEMNLNSAKIYLNSSKVYLNFGKRISEFWNSDFGLLKFRQIAELKFISESKRTNNFKYSFYCAGPNLQAVWAARLVPNLALINFLLKVNLKTVG